jgi:protein-S-isoprenylcysteine O-methyltransferase Ste14
LNPSFHILLFAGWTAYVLLHSAMASVAFKLWIEKITGRYYRYYRLFYSVFAAVTLILLLVYQFSNKSVMLYEPDTLMYFFSGLFAIAGGAVMIACIIKYFMNLSGVEVLLKKKQQPVLEQKGLHTYVRHPLYAGTLLFIWALLLSFPLLSNLIACVVITVYTLIGIKIEEEKLVIEFGEAYRHYASSTPMLIPHFRRKIFPPRRR